MDESTQKDFALFAMSVGYVRGFATRALADPELLGEFTSRGVNRTDLEQLSESADEIARSFYNKPKPE